MLKDNVALVTGASRGIGQAIALTLGKHQATVVGTATTPEGAEKISQYLKEHHISGQGMVLDVTNPASIQDVITAVGETYAPPAILVNNAAITRDNLMLRMKDEEWDSIIETNLSAIYRVTKACLKGMLKARYGRIISITSVVGFTGNPGQANYAAAKAGLVGFSKSLAQEVASRNITVNTVAPGFIETDMTRDLTAEHQALLLGRIPMGRMGQPEEIADAVAFLASPQAGYITGTTLHVNGGMYMN